MGFQRCFNGANGSNIYWVEMAVSSSLKSLLMSVFKVVQHNGTPYVMLLYQRI